MCPQYVWQHMESDMLSTSVFWCALSECVMVVWQAYQVFEVDNGKSVVISTGMVDITIISTILIKIPKQTNYKCTKVRFAKFHNGND